MHNVGLLIKLNNPTYSTSFHPFEAIKLFALYSSRRYADLLLGFKGSFSSVRGSLLRGWICEEETGINQYQKE